MLTQYRDYAPTTFDTQGLALPDRQDWYVAPCGTNRDAAPLQRSNWRVQQTMLAHLETEIHRFGHWACGWFEILLVAPSDAAKAELAKIADGLADYPVLSEDDYGLEALEELRETWINCYAPDLRRTLDNLLWAKGESIDAEGLCQNFALDLESDDVQAYCEHRSGDGTIDQDRMSRLVTGLITLWQQRPCDPRATRRYMERTRHDIKAALNR
jgi:hypothetical protein